MNKRLLLFPIIALSWIVGALAIAGWATGILPLTPTNDTVAALQPEPAELAELAAIADAKLQETVGSDQTVPQPDGTTRTIPGIRIDGQVPTASHLTLIDVIALDDARSIDAAQSFVEFPAPVDVWVATWQHESVAVHDWQEPATLTVRVIVERESMKLLDAQVSLRNPNPPPPSEPQGSNAPTRQTRCTPIEGGLPGARFCTDAQELHR